MMDIPYSLLSLSRLADLASQINTIVKKKHPKEPMLKQFGYSLDNACQETLKTLGDDAGSDFAAKVREADQERDQAYKALRNFVKAGTYRLNATYRETAEKVFATMVRRNLQLYNFSYAEQSTSMKLLLSDLKELEADVQLLKGAAWVKELEESQKSFEEVYADRVSSEASQSTLTNAEAKKTLVPALDILLNALMVLNASGQPEGIANTVDEVETIIQKTVAEVRK